MLRSNHARGRRLKNQGCDRTFLGWSWARYTLKTRYDTCSCGHARGSWQPGTRPRGHVGQAGSSEGWRGTRLCSREERHRPGARHGDHGGPPGAGPRRVSVKTGTRPSVGTLSRSSHAQQGVRLLSHTGCENRGKPSQAAAASVKEKGRINKRGSRPGKSLGLRDETGDSGPEKRFRFPKANCGPQPLRRVPPASDGAHPPEWADGAPSCLCRKESTRYSQGGHASMDTTSGHFGLTFSVPTHT